MPRGRSNFKNSLPPILKWAMHEVAMFYFVRGARWMLEEELGLPHLSAEELEDDPELQPMAGKRISTNDILLGFRNKEGWEEDDYSLKALRQIYDKLRNGTPNKPFRC